MTGRHFDRMSNAAGTTKSLEGTVTATPAKNDRQSISITLSERPSPSLNASIIAQLIKLGSDSRR